MTDEPKQKKHPSLRPPLSHLHIVNDKRPVCIMSCNSLMMSRVAAATLRACTLSTYVGVGGTVNSPGVCTFIYCWEMLIVATASLCVGTGAVPVLHHGLKTAAGNEEKTGRGRNGREGKRGKHFRKEWHGTQTRQSLKPADNPADWFGHIRAGTKPPSGRAGHVSAGWNADWQLF